MSDHIDNTQTYIQQRVCGASAEVVGLPIIEAISQLSLSGDDVLVVKIPQKDLDNMSSRRLTGLTEILRNALKKHTEIVFMPSEWGLSVIVKDQADAR